ncbi:lytic transglycosylase domain-containing protein [Chitinimonas koreensis]|uniref:lytic transglycosylase domain-containing protein n=1 Tax=Chitinimonas koreensis TaxID=356302 RepID=UPI0003FC7F89|nr:lytic transglycosylase domain-containing protein [Chitinimonas koreensis]QNM95521.1 lytic transglycosylase domain-containing protein [Chitinimonas koreensis]
MESLTVAALITLGQACAPSIESATLVRQVTHESGRYVYRIGINDRSWRLPRQPRSLAAAVATARRLDARGFSFDAGLGQLNNHTVRRMGLSWEQVFTPCDNLRAAERHLLQDYRRALRQYGNHDRAVLGAFSAYNTGSLTRGLSNGYVAKVRATRIGTTAANPAQFRASKG